MICGNCPGKGFHDVYRIKKQTKDELILECVNCGDLTHYKLEKVREKNEM